MLALTHPINLNLPIFTIQVFIIAYVRRLFTASYLSYSLEPKVAMDNKIPRGPKNKCRNFILKNI